MALEALRRVGRNVFGYQSSVYVGASTILAQCEILRREGWKGLRQLHSAERGAQHEVALTLRGLRWPIVVRPGTDDVPSVLNNVIRREYGQFDAEFSPGFIIDAGAYIGDTTAYFLSRFPNARVLALEPNEESFALASRNLVPYGDRVELIKAALWSTETTVRIDGHQTSSRVGPSGVVALTETVESLMRRSGDRTVDLLKLDIEGAECEVIAGGVGSWLNQVRLLLLETHGDDSEAYAIGTLRSAGFVCRRFRNVWYCLGAARQTTGSG